MIFERQFKHGREGSLLNFSQGYVAHIFTIVLLYLSQKLTHSISSARFEGRNMIFLIVVHPQVPSLRGKYTPTFKYLAKIFSEICDESVRAYGFTSPKLEVFWTSTPSLFLSASAIAPSYPSELKAPYTF